MLTLGGGVALTPFQRDRFTTKAIQQGIALQDLRAHYFYIADLEAPLDDRSLDILENLVDGRADQAGAIVEDGDPLLVIPRWGTRSPWSTKATDIAKHCGLSQVRRLERGIAWRAVQGVQDESARRLFTTLVHDPMTESALRDVAQLPRLFEERAAGPLAVVDILSGGLDALLAANRAHGFALSPQECAYLVAEFTALGRNPTDAELMMFAQVNSEHCRHKIFNAAWTIDGTPENLSLFAMVRTTHQSNGQKTLVAYKDNAAVLEGYSASWFMPDPKTGNYRQIAEPLHIVAKVETHNHPTAISPFPGAATGSGGEIRDEGATGRGGKPKAGVTGFSVSDLRIPDLAMPWELPEQMPARIAAPLQIMLEGPIGAASFNNEFGRPNIAGYFRTFEVAVDEPTSPQIGRAHV